jgi:hypothetical protein
MAGMLTGNRTVRIEVMGNSPSSNGHTSNYTVTVPYSSMSKTMQSISRSGGKIVSVQIGDKKVVADPSPVVNSPAETEANAPAKSGEDPKSGEGKQKKRFILF